MDPHQANSLLGAGACAWVFPKVAPTQAEQQHVLPDQRKDRPPCWRRRRAAVHRVATQGAGAELEWHGRPMHAGELAGRIAFAGVAHPGASRALAARLREGLERTPRKRHGRGKPGGETP